jgi:hypothetical protein
MHIDTIAAANPSFNQETSPLQGETNPPISENNEKAIDLGAVAQKYFEGMTQLNKARRIVVGAAAGLGLVAIRSYVSLKDCPIPENQSHSLLSAFYLVGLLFGIGLGITASKSRIPDELSVFLKEQYELSAKKQKKD